MRQNGEKRSSLYEWVAIVSASLIVITIIFTFLFRFVDVDGASMETTLYSGERLVLSCLPYTPQRGDIVVIDRGVDRDGNQREPLIKRVIGLPGDTVRIDETSGAVYVNGQLLNEPYVHGPTPTIDLTGPVTVPEGRVFVLGDNRANSKDSRDIAGEDAVGCPLLSQIVGKVVLRISPLDRFGGLYDES